MFNQTFYFSTTRKYVSLFGTLFNDIVIVRHDPSANTDQIIKVPIEYSPKDKMTQRVLQDPNIDRPFSLLLPRMAFDIKGFKYDNTRKLNTVGRVVKKDIDNPNKLWYQYNAVPYNLDFSLYVYVKNTEDGNKIVEQILPFFTPVWTTTVSLIPEMDITLDIPVSIGPVVPPEEILGPGDLANRRVIIWTLNFTMRGFFFGPIKKTGIILIANTTFYIANTTPIQDSVGHVEMAERMIEKPGLDALGKPVNYSGTAPVPNTVPTIPVYQITADSDYGYIETYESIPIGVARPIGGANTSETAAQLEVEEHLNE